MSERPQLLYCQDILDSGAAILSYVQGISFDAFEHDHIIILQKLFTTS